MIQVQYPTAGGSSAARSRRKRISADLGREEKKGPVSSCCSAKACFNNNAGSVELPVHEAVTIISQVLSPSSRIPILLRCSSSIPLLAKRKRKSRCRIRASLQMCIGYVVFWYLMPASSSYYGWRLVARFLQLPLAIVQKLCLYQNRAAFSLPTLVFLFDCEAPTAVAGGRREDKSRSPGKLLSV